ncbi:MAG: sigma-70 family RNA polymerase sigma factor [Firmicutes bacterium]|nr:sigma-70 family RNA polymerase sigma factor [Bacillota bacterium]
MDEALLIERCKEGDDEAFSLLIDRYQQKVYNTAFRMMGNYHDASDCAQEVFLRIFRSIRSFRGESSFSTWVYHITVNVCKDELRSRQRHIEDSIDEMLQTPDGERHKEIASDSPEPSEVYERTEMMERLQELINELEPNYRMILLMREHDEMSYQEIADMLGLSIGTVKSRINRARIALRKKIIADGKLFAMIERLYDIENKGKDGGMSELLGI